MSDLRTEAESLARAESERRGLGWEKRGEGMREMWIESYVEELEAKAADPRIALIEDVEVGDCDGQAMLLGWSAANDVLAILDATKENHE